MKIVINDAIMVQMEIDVYEKVIDDTIMVQIEITVN
jgi:hypothetical protein